MLWLAYPALLAAMGFLTTDERRELRGLLRPRVVIGRLRALRRGTAPETTGPDSGSEVYEVALRDEDSR